MNQDFLDEIKNLMNDPQRKAEALMPGYTKDLQKIIDQIISSAKKRFNYDAILTAFDTGSIEHTEAYADYLVRSIVIEFGASLDYESGLAKCESRLIAGKIPFKQDEILQFTKMLLPVLKKELGAIQKINYLADKLTPIDEIIERVKKEIEIETDYLGLIL